MECKEYAKKLVIILIDSEVSEIKHHGATSKNKGLLFIQRALVKSEFYDLKLSNPIADLPYI